MQCKENEPYVPVFESPYPDKRPGRISNVRYKTPLNLCRCIEVSQFQDETEANFVVSQPYKVSVELDGVEREITVPEGMLTDLSSVPWFARWFIARVGRHLEASIVHDFLYIAWQDLENRPICEPHRKYADRLFYVAMKERRVWLLKRGLVYLALRAFGAGAYVQPNALRYVKDT